MITPAEILELFGQIGSVANGDFILLHQVASNTTKKITAELLRAYLNQGFSISVNEEGYLVIGGEATQTKIAGVDIRIGQSGFEVSRDGGITYEELISFSDLFNSSVVFCTESEYDYWVNNEQIDEDKIYMTYEE